MSEIVVNSENKCLLVGLGGSGGKVITKLYERLIRERGEGFKSNVTCVAIDTDKDELNQLAQLGVKKIQISGVSTVGQLFGMLGDDVAEWCPNTGNEGNFLSSRLDNGASQCRLKSRLCFANFLKDQNNALAQVLEEFLEVSSTNESAQEAPPTVYIVSSIAGGTGSGIFIQTALYIKQFFRKYNLNAVVYGLFACPDIYKNVVNPQQLPSLYANAYAVVRELNAFNLICGNETTAAYGGKLELDMELSTRCEGKLFEKDSRGRYGDKPYDVLYFIDRVNSLSKVLGGIEKYYEAMANIAYSHLYIEISGEILSGESNEMHARSLSPCAIYGSAGAAALRYPFEDMIRYFADRAISESVSDIWTELDKSWANYLVTKNADARATGRTAYVPAAGERAERYIEEFERLSKDEGMTAGKLAFMAPMVERNGVSAVDALFKNISATAKSELQNDKRLKELKVACKLDKLDKKAEKVQKKIANASDENTMFTDIKEIDDQLAVYCKKGLSHVVNLAISFANRIFCDDSQLFGAYDEDDCSIVKSLLRMNNSIEREWVHPVAARYLLYRFYGQLCKNIKRLFPVENTPMDDKEEFYNYLIEAPVAEQRAVLNSGAEEISNADILKGLYRKLFGARKAKNAVSEYFNELNTNMDTIETSFNRALQYFALIQIKGRVEGLIREYEFFFDNIGEFVKKANGAVMTGETKHENSKGEVYVCASAAAKRGMYETVGKKINLQTGSIISSVGESLFRTMRDKSAQKNQGKKVAYRTEVRGVEEFFHTVSQMVAEKVAEEPSIQGVVQMDAFQAILREYALTYPEYADDETHYSSDSAAKNRLDQFIATKLAGLAKMAAPCLMYDVEDTYSCMFSATDERGAQVEKQKVANSYRFLSHNQDVADTITNLVGAVEGAGGVVDGFYRGVSAELPKDKEGQTVYIDYVRSRVVDPYTILCYSTVHCLQPYQIYAFDEIKGGVYYKNYSERIAEMYSKQLYSLTPHLDKRWHKHGVMPYINVAKEVERRYDLAKAFLYALCYGKIRFVQDDGESKLVYGDLDMDREMEILFYKGRSIPTSKINRAMNWFADQEDLIERYAAQFDMEIDAEVEKLSKYSDTVGGYKTAINNYARILNQMKRNVFQDMDQAKKTTKKTTKKATKKAEKKELNSILTFAWKLHLAEENELDKDYAELLVQTLCQIIKKYAKAPYNREDIENRNAGSSSYRNYLDVARHIASAFLEDFAASVGQKLGLQEDAEEADARRRKNSFGRNDTDLGSEPGNLSLKGANKGALGKNQSFEWVRALLDGEFSA